VSGLLLAVGALEGFHVRPQASSRGQRSPMAGPKRLAGGGTVSAGQDELRELVERLPDEQVPAQPAEARRHLTSASEHPRRPERCRGASEELLDESFVRLA
jgi:hypothetical protein